MNRYANKTGSRYLATFACLAWIVPALSMAQDQATPDEHDVAVMSPSMMQARANVGMNDDASQTMLLVDQLEFADGYHSHGIAWEAEGWYGNDENKLWLRSEGSSSDGRIEDGDLEALWNRPVSAFWSTQLGVRHDLGLGPHRNWAAFGVEGLAPYWFEVEATAYASGSGRLAARGRLEYTLRFTQRLLLQPELEVNFYDKRDPAQRVGGGLSDAELGLRLRYEVTRQFAPYVGLAWVRRFGATAGFARDERQAVFDRQIVVGIRFWM